MSGKLRVGIAGCGIMGKRHCRAVNESPLMELAAIADVREPELRAAEKEFSPGRACADGEELARDPGVQAVVIAMPTSVRTPVAMRCFEAGKHVMLEKPAAMSAKEIEAMIKASAGLTVGCFSSRFRFRASAQAAEEFVSGGGQGDIRLVRVRAVSPDNGPPKAPPPEWRLKKDLNGGGILVNWGCYDLDYVLGITGWRLEPETVLAQTWGISPRLSSRAAPGSDAETHFCALIKCKNGAAISFERGEFMPAEGEKAWQIVGSEGTLTMDMNPAEGRSRVVFFEGFPDRQVEQRVVWEGAEDASSVGPFALEDFASAVLNKGRPKTGLAESLLIQKVTEAIYRSAAEGGAVRID